LEWRAAVHAADETGNGYETFEHTADVGLHVWAESLAGLFELAARAFAALIVDGDMVEDRETRQVSAEGDALEELLVSWLDEILYAWDAEGFAPRDVHVLEFSESRIAGEIRGEQFDRSRHTVLHSVKAVTYHGLQVVRAGGRYEVRIVFDV
jgi:SHS2 domain-containing protein